MFSQCYRLQHQLLHIIPLWSAFRSRKSPSLLRFGQTLFAVAAVPHFVKISLIKTNLTPKVYLESFDTEIWWHQRYLSPTRREKWLYLETTGVISPCLSPKSKFVLSSRIWMMTTLWAAYLKQLKPDRRSKSNAAFCFFLKLIWIQIPCIIYYPELQVFFTHPREGWNGPSPSLHRGRSNLRLHKGS